MGHPADTDSGGELALQAGCSPSVIEMGGEDQAIVEAAGASRRLLNSEVVRARNVLHTAGGDRGISIAERAGIYVDVLSKSPPFCEESLAGNAERWAGAETGQTVRQELLVTEV